MSTMIVRFPGGKRVDAEFSGFTVHTDQPVAAGGGGTAPQPFDLFLASIATCAGIYVKGFCDSRGLASEGLRLEMTVEREPGGHHGAKVGLDIHLPPGCPETHREAVIRAADLCAVKKHILKPPAFEIRAV